MGSQDKTDFGKNISVLMLFTAMSFISAAGYDINSVMKNSFEDMRLKFNVHSDEILNDRDSNKFSNFKRKLEKRFLLNATSMTENKPLKRARIKDVYFHKFYSHSGPLSQDDSYPIQLKPYKPKPNKHKPAKITSAPTTTTPIPITTTTPKIYIATLQPNQFPPVQPNGVSPNQPPIYTAPLRPNQFPPIQPYGVPPNQFPPMQPNGVPPNQFPPMQPNGVPPNQFPPMQPYGVPPNQPPNNKLQSKPHNFFIDKFFRNSFGEDESITE